MSYNIICTLNLVFYTRTVSNRELAQLASAQRSGR